MPIAKPTSCVGASFNGTEPGLRHIRRAPAEINDVHRTQFDAGECRPASAAEREAAKAAVDELRRRRRLPVASDVRATRTAARGITKSRHDWNQTTEAESRGFQARVAIRERFRVDPARSYAPQKIETNEKDDDGGHAFVVVAGRPLEACAEPFAPAGFASCCPPRAAARIPARIARAPLCRYRPRRSRRYDALCEIAGDWSRRRLMHVEVSENPASRRTSPGP